jgi:hypothetical protein
MPRGRPRLRRARRSSAGPPCPRNDRRFEPLAC